MMKTRADNPKGKPKRKDLESTIEKQNKTIVVQHQVIEQLQSQLYWADVLKNPCHESDRMMYLQEERNK